MSRVDKVFLSGLFVAITVALGVDVSSDLQSGAPWEHVGVEVFIILAAAAGFLWTWRDNSMLRTEIDGISSELSKAREESAAWHREHEALIQGLGLAIETQLSKWGLSDAERDVALLLLKGCSFKEIAGVRQSSEKTVRQHSLRIYQKSGLAGRAELAAFFLEDLLTPLDSLNPVRKDVVRRRTVGSTGS